MINIFTVGCEVVDWFCADLLLTRAEAIALGKLMIAQGLLVVLFPETKDLSDFLDEADALYAFKEVRAEHGPPNAKLTVMALSRLTNQQKPSKKRLPQFLRN